MFDANADQRAIGQRRQHLPVPLGGAHPAHVRSIPRGTRAWARHWRSLAITVGALSAAVGTWLGLASPDISVFLDASGVHVGNMVLKPLARDGVMGTSVYSGDATFAVRIATDGALVGSAVTYVGGVRSSGVCHMRMQLGGFIEDCRFTMGGRSFTSRDVYTRDAHSWLRRYSDGSQTRVDVPSAARLVPVPFPIGLR